MLSLANLQFLEKLYLDSLIFLWQEDVKLPTITEAESKMIDLDEEESSGDYLDDDQDIDKVEEEDDYEDDYDEVRMILQGSSRAYKIRLFLRFPIFVFPIAQHNS